MKLVLILMIKNESRILKRCLESLEGIVDAWCICDTGSTDDTVTIANEFLENRKGCLSVVPWQNFGYNRTKSFEVAQQYVRDGLQWDLKDTYGLLLDADMVFVSGTLHEELDGQLRVDSRIEHKILYFDTHYRDVRVWLTYIS